MPGKSFTYETLIRESHLDTFGHVNNAQYLTLFEEARWEMITTGGHGQEYVQKVRKGPIILEVNVKFRKELRLREKIRIVSEVTEMSSKIGRIKQVLYNQAGEASGIAEFVVGFFDMQERKLIPPSPEWLKAIGWNG